MAKKIPFPEPREVSVVDAVSEAFCELQSLGEEMRSWADAMEEKLSHNDKYERVSEAADALENISEPDYPDTLAVIKVKVQDPRPVRRVPSRADRCSFACSILEGCRDALEEFKNDTKNSETARDEADTLLGAVSETIDNAESVEFPGMYG